jgi:ribonuclease HI
VLGESSAHVIWRCPASVAVWAECSRRIQKTIIPEGGFLTIFEHFSKRLGAEDLELVAIIAQKLWLRRNTVVHGGAFLNPICLIKCATEELEGFHLATANGQPVSQATVNRSQPWVKPPEGKLKINWDAAVCKKKKIMGVGIVIRDHMGVVRAAMCLSKPYVSDPVVAEALGAREAVELCRKLGLQSFLLEGDAKEIVSEIASGGASVGKYGSIVDHTLSLLSHVADWSVHFVPRESNVVAHNLARQAIVQRFTQVWIDVFPSCIAASVIAEQQVGSSDL